MSGQAENLAQLGQFLREVRESMQISLDQAAGELHIRADFLGALESGDWGKLPAVAYGRGYLRRYTAYLGIATGEVMETLDRLQGKVSSDLHYFDPITREQKPSGLIIAGCVIVMALVVISWVSLSGPDEEPEVVSHYPMPARLEAMLDEAQAPGVAETARPSQACLELMREREIVCYYDRPSALTPSMVTRGWVEESARLGRNL